MNRATPPPRSRPRPRQPTLSGRFRGRGGRRERGRTSSWSQCACEGERRLSINGRANGSPTKVARWPARFAGPLRRQLLREPRDALQFEESEMAVKRRKRRKKIQLLAFCASLWLKI